MKFIKTHLDDIVRCYCTSHMFIDKECYAFFASENPNSECYSYTGKDFKKKKLFGIRAEAVVCLLFLLKIEKVNF